MKITTSTKQPGIWQEMKTAANTMWKWFTAAPESQINNSDLTLNEPELKQLITQKDIEGTPFKVTGHHEKGYWITMGPYRLTAPKKTKHEAILDLQKEKWNIITRVITIVNEFDKNKENLTIKK